MGASPPNMPFDVDTTTKVVVLGLHHGGLAIARSLGRWGIDVLGVTDDAEVPGAKSRYLSRVEVWDDLHTGTPEVAERVMELARSFSSFPLVIATSDDTAMMMAEHADQLQECCLFARQDPELTRRLADKQSNYHLAKEMGLPVPECTFTRNREDVVKVSHDSTYPVVLKAIDGGKLFAACGKKMVICETSNALLYWYDALSPHGADNLMVQEYIPGKDDTIWIYNGYFDADSRCLGGGTGKKIRQTPIHVGATSLGIVLENAEVQDQTVSFMEKIGYTGILDIGFRYDARDGKYKLLDPNPRIGSTFRLFVDRNGMDVVRMLYLDKTGQSVPAIEMRSGRKWMIEDKDFESGMMYVREGEMTWLEWLQSLEGVEETAWFARDDLRPFFAVLRIFSRQVLKWPFKRVGRLLSRGAG